MVSMSITWMSLKPMSARLARISHLLHARSGVTVCEDGAPESACANDKNFALFAQEGLDLGNLSAQRVALEQEQLSTWLTHDVAAGETLVCSRARPIQYLINVVVSSRPVDGLGDYSGGHGFVVGFSIVASTDRDRGTRFTALTDRNKLTNCKTDCSHRFPKSIHRSRSSQHLIACCIRHPCMLLLRSAVLRWICNFVSDNGGPRSSCEDGTFIVGEDK